jgi:hypothetical protein
VLAKLVWTLLSSFHLASLALHSASAASTDQEQLVNAFSCCYHLDWMFCKASLNRYKLDGVFVANQTLLTHSRSNATTRSKSLAIRSGTGLLSLIAKSDRQAHNLWSHLPTHLGDCLSLDDNALRDVLRLRTATSLKLTRDGMQRCDIHQT